MKRSRFTEEQIIGVLREQEAGGKTADVRRRHGISPATLYQWKARFGGLEVSEARRLRTLEAENVRLKKLLADAMLDNAVLNEVTARKWRRRGMKERCWRCARGTRDQRAAGVRDPRRRPEHCALPVEAGRWGNAIAPAGAGGGAAAVRLSSARPAAGPRGLRLNHKKLRRLYR